MIRPLAVVAALCLLAGCGDTAGPKTGPTNQTPSPVSDTAPPITVAMEAPDPQAISIPVLEVSSTLVPLGLTADGQHEVPPLSQPEQAGWFQPGPEPGESGPAIVLGHVNGNGHPGVFANLHQMKPGDTVTIDGLTFVVYEVMQAPKDAFPADRVYGETGAPELRLITCGGAFDRASGNYLSNIIAFAKIQG